MQKTHKSIKQNSSNTHTKGNHSSQKCAPNIIGRLSKRTRNKLDRNPSTRQFGIQGYAKETTSMQAFSRKKEVNI